MALSPLLVFLSDPLEKVKEAQELLNDGGLLFL
jgi:hypothetical protein